MPDGSLSPAGSREESSPAPAPAPAPPAREADAKSRSGAFAIPSPGRAPSSGHCRKPRRWRGLRLLRRASMALSTVVELFATMRWQPAARLCSKLEKKQRGEETTTAGAHGLVSYVRKLL